jgi:hypothetical protein
LKQSLDAGTVKNATVDTALGRSLLWKFRLGLFDDPASQTLAKLGKESINSTAAQQLVQEAAAQGLILLRNVNSTLPISGGQKVAVVGSHAKATRALLSDYYGDEVCFGPASGDPKTAAYCIAQIGDSIAAANTRSANLLGGSLEASETREEASETRVEPGIGVTNADNTTAVAAAMAAVEWSDITVLALGLEHSLEHEGMDRQNTFLPASQVTFALQVLASGKPVVLVLVNGGALSIDALLNGPKLNNCSQGQFEHDVDYLNQADQTYTHANTLADCCALCANREGVPCKYFTFTGNQTMHDKAHSNCYMKSSSAGRKPSAGYISGSCHASGSGASPMAIVEAFYPNQAGAAAIGPALFGETNRWGRLPITIYPASYDQQLPIQNLRMRADAASKYPGRGYRYYVEKPLFSFGDGLSLTTFTTSCTSSQSTEKLLLNCTVHNTGSLDGDEVLLLFHRPPTAAAGALQNPIKRLIDFNRVAVAAGKSSAVAFSVGIPQQLLLINEAGGERQVAGTHIIEIQGGPSFKVILH